MRKFSLVLRNIMNNIMKTHNFRNCQDFCSGSKCYEEAVHALNTLQSNAACLEKIREERDKNRHLQLGETLAMAGRAGVTLKELNKLSVIHVSGTKGKGSTCAFAESILCKEGFKTGFFSSPHLIEVRERIRVKGRPISKKMFAHYFWECYDKLQATKDEQDGKMPAYFRFLTIMAFHVFLSEKVDVAIMEVGIGGEYDSTNIIQTPVVCGVTSLGYDHMSILGSTIQSIAWHKAGIFKKNTPAVTVPQPVGAMDILVERAHERQCPLYLAPSDHLTRNGADRRLLEGIKLGISGKMQQLNACLALQLCRIWKEDHDLDLEARQLKYSSKNIDVDMDPPTLPPVEMTPSITRGLADCRWLGRNQVMKKGDITYFIDGAHTVESMQCCTEWFLQESNTELATIQKPVIKVLIFNLTGDRNPEGLLQQLVLCNFDCVIFCPNILTSSGNRTDQCNFTVTEDTQLAKCLRNRDVWQKLWLAHQQKSSANVQNFQQKIKVQLPSTNLDFHQSDIRTNQPQADWADDAHLGIFFPAIQDALEWLNSQVGSQTSCSVDDKLPHELKDNPTVQSNQNSLSNGPGTLPSQHLQVLCTGSLHLVGNTLGLLGIEESEQNNH